MHVMQLTKTTINMRQTKATMILKMHWQFITMINLKKITLKLMLQIYKLQTAAVALLMPFVRRSWTKEMKLHVFFLFVLFFFSLTYFVFIVCLVKLLKRWLWLNLILTFISIKSHMQKVFLYIYVCALCLFFFKRHTILVQNKTHKKKWVLALCLKFENITKVFCERCHWSFKKLKGICIGI